MRWWINALSSTVGQKFVMGITGLLLCLFLVVHLAGNLLMYAGPETYNGYAHALHSQEWFVKTAEVGLLVLFLLHIGLAIKTSRDNRSARSVQYAVKQTKQEARTAEFDLSSFMFVTGAVVLAFVLLHLIDFTLEARTFLVDSEFGYEGKEPFDKAVMILKNPLSAGVYLIGCIALGVHLGHGASSAFQSLGINHPKYNSCIRCAGITFAWIVGIGFPSFVVWAMLTS